MTFPPNQLRPRPQPAAAGAPPAQYHPQGGGPAPAGSPQADHRGPTPGQPRPGNHRPAPVATKAQYVGGPGSSRGILLGILSVILFITGPLGCALGFVSASQAKRAETSPTLGVIGFILGLATCIAIAAYIGFQVLDLWKVLDQMADRY